MTIADISIVATFSTLTLVQPVDNEKFPLITAWFNKMRSHPFYVNGNIPGLRKLKEILEKQSSLPIGLVE